MVTLHLAGQHIPRFDSPYSEEIPPDVQPEPSMAQLEAMSFHPVTSCLGEEANVH